MRDRWPSAYNVLNTLHQAGYKAYVVGGAVRDHLLGLPCKDLDVATDALPEQVMDLFHKTFATGIAHGTVTVVHEEPIEVTTFRVESEYVDKRRPSEVQFVRELRQDLARRDFTINAMALSKEEELVDYFDGQLDLQKKQIRAVGIAEERFEEDALRILRGIRFAAQLSFTIEATTLEAMKSKSHLLTFIAKERVKQEVSQIWLFQNPEIALSELKKTYMDASLPGSYSVLPVRHKPFQMSAHGWAWFHFFQKDPYTFPYSNNEKRLNAEVKRLIPLLAANGWSYHSVFNFSKDALVVAHEIMMDESKFVSLSDLDVWLEQAPIRHLEELALSGTELMKLTGLKAGPWIKQVKHQLADEILGERLENSQSALEKWVNEHVK